MLNDSRFVKSEKFEMFMVHSKKKANKKKNNKQNELERCNLQMRVLWRILV